MTLYPRRPRAARHVPTAGHRPPYAPAPGNHDPACTLAVVIHPDAGPASTVALYLAMATHVVEWAPDGYRVTRCAGPRLTYPQVMSRCDFVAELRAGSVAFTKVTLPDGLGGGPNAA